MRKRNIKEFLVFDSELNRNEFIIVVMTFMLSGFLFDFIKIEKSYFYSTLLSFCVIILIHFIHFRRK